jgi:hypothetical protein
MPRVGRIVTDPRAGAYCHVTLDGGDKIVVSHDRGGGQGGMLAIEVSRFMGFSSERIFACNLDSPQGQAILGWLTRGAELGTLAATPLGAGIEFVRDAGTLAELRTRSAALMATR